MPDASLREMLDEVRGKTLALLDGVTDAQARRAPAGLANTILWHAGHSYVVVEWLWMQALGRAPQSPQGWFEMFSWASRPQRVAADRWPALADVVLELRRQHYRLRGLLDELGEADLAGRAAGSSGRSVRHHLIHALHDEACHSGEIWLLRKMQHVQSGSVGNSDEPLA